MDIFNRKKIEELELKLEKVERERMRYMNLATSLQTTLAEVDAAAENTPEDCKKGPWCKACEFSKTIPYTDYNLVQGFGDISTIVVCNKGESCQHFIQKETE